MSYQQSNFRGDETYTIHSTGDVVVGDEVAFERATFTGSWRNASFAGFERVEGKVIRDSYGRTKQHHTFTLELSDGSELKIKGRNLYRQGVYRKRWADESSRVEVAREKHARGDEARRARAARIEARKGCCVNLLPDRDASSIPRQE